MNFQFHNQCVLGDLELQTGVELVPGFLVPEELTNQDKFIIGWVNRRCVPDRHERDENDQ